MSPTSNAFLQRAQAENCLTTIGCNSISANNRRTLLTLKPASLHLLHGRLQTQSSNTPPTQPDGIYLCGGGTKNQFLTELITAYSPCPVTTTAELGIDPQTVEAVAFAWLAQQTLSHLPVTCLQLRARADQ